MSENETGGSNISNGSEYQNKTEKYLYELLRLRYEYRALYYFDSCNANVLKYRETVKLTNRPLIIIFLVE